MADYLSQHCSKQGLKASKEAFELLKGILENDDDGSGFSIEFSEDKGNPNEGKIFVMAEEIGDTDLLPDTFLEALGGLIESNGLPYLEFGYGLTCSRMVCDGFGGGDYRINTKGEFIYPEIKWPQ